MSVKAHRWPVQHTTHSTLPSYWNNAHAQLSNKLTVIVTVIVAHAHAHAILIEPAKETLERSQQTKSTKGVFKWSSPRPFVVRFIHALIFESDTDILFVLHGRRLWTDCVSCKQRTRTRKEMLRTKALQALSTPRSRSRSFTFTFTLIYFKQAKST